MSPWRYLLQHQNKRWLPFLLKDLLYSVLVYISLGTHSSVKFKYRAFVLILLSVRHSIFFYFRCQEHLDLGSNCFICVQKVFTGIILSECCNNPLKQAHLLFSLMDRLRTRTKLGSDPTKTQTWVFCPVCIVVCKMSPPTGLPSRVRRKTFRTGLPQSRCNQRSNVESGNPPDLSHSSFLWS